jgi:hypothetical protein
MEEQRLRAFEDRVLRRPKMEEVTDDLEGTAQ